MSTVGLLATTNYKNQNELQLIDSTGIVKCRAFAIGRYSNQINQCLLKENFANLSVEDGVQLLLDIVQKCSSQKQGKSQSENGRQIDATNVDAQRGEKDNGFGAWDVSLNDLHVEIAVVVSKSEILKRMRQSTLSQAIRE
jgi:hypothetical protein